jgi:ADP-ribosylglycohydrolase
MLIEGAIGDAYGAGFEFAWRTKIRNKNNLTQYEAHPNYRHMCGMYTDDTQMSIALAELILSGKEWTPFNIASAFVEAFKRDPRKGYARRFYNFLTDISSGQEFLDKIINKSERNGAAMRAYVIGLYGSEEEVMEKSRMQSAVTHDTPKAINAGVAVSLMAHALLHGKAMRKDLTQYLNDWQGTDWKGVWKGKVDCAAIDTVESVLTVLQGEPSMSAMLKASIEFGGDVDTVASISLALASMDSGIENDLPRFLYDDLENGSYGRDYLIGLDSKLGEHFGK